MSDEEIIEVVNVLKANDKMLKDSGIGDNLWGKAAEYIMFLQSENAALRERLKKAYELPVKVGDSVCRFFGDGSNEELSMRSSTVKSITINKKGIRVEFTDTFYGGYIENDFDFLTQEDLEKEKFIFIDDTYYVCAPEAAKAHLAELKGGNKDE